MNEHLLAAEAILSRLRAKDPMMPSLQVHAFLLVALNPGACVSELKALAGTTHASMSRNLLDLSVHERSGTRGLGLIEREKGWRTTYTLTREGEAVIKAMPGGGA